MEQFSYINTIILACYEKIKYLSAGFYDPINLLFTFLILFFVICGCYQAKKNKYPIKRDYYLYACGILGIFGTFIGIYLGLSDFDTKNISQSIPLLLDGMKIAFFTSILGMLATIILKGIYAHYESIYTVGTNDEFEILKNIEKHLEKTTAGIEEVTKTLNGCFKSDEEYSLVSQVKLIRQEMIDGRRELSKVFMEFTEHFSKMASESLVNELKNVVDKFNVMLNELVSQSFIDLKNSTDNLNQWQAEHKEFLKSQSSSIEELFKKINELYVLYQETVDKLTSYNQNLQSIDSSLQSITISGEKLEEHLTEISNQNLILKETLNEISIIGEKAEEVIPSIKEGFTEVKEQILQIQQNTNSFMKEQSKTISESVNENTMLLTRTLENATNELSEVLSVTDSFVKNIISEYERNYEEINTKSQELIEQIEQALEKELTKSLESFAGMMVTLSQKFTSDYTPLTDKLKELLQIAEKIK